MFKQVKSAFFWYYLYKMRKRIIIIFFLLLVLIFSSSIYSDVLEYLRLSKQLQYLELALILKWSIILTSLTLIFYLILTMFKKDKLDKDEKSFTKNPIKTKNNQVNKNKLTKREESFLYKKDLNSKADKLYSK